MNVKSQKGSITLFVLVSCLFFLASVACVNMYMQSKQVAVDREYRQVKANYEKDINNMDSIYAELTNKNNLSVNFGIPEINQTSKKISVKIYINLEYLNIKTLKYGWYYDTNYINNPSISRITNWTYVENQNGENEFVATYNYIENDGFYYLCVMVDNQEFWLENPVSTSYINDGMILHLDAINNVGMGDSNHSTTTNIWKDLSGNSGDVTLRTTGTSGPVWESDSLSFDGVDDYATGAATSNGDITVEFVGRQNNTSNSGVLYMINSWGSNVTDPTMQLWGSGSGQLINGRMLVPKNQELPYREIGSEQLGRFDAESKAYFTITKNNNTIKVYWNGQLKKEYNDQEFIDRFNITNMNFTIGKWHTSNSYYSNENVNAFRIYNRPLTEDEVKQNYYTDKIRFKIED